MRLVFLLLFHIYPMRSTQGEKESSGYQPYQKLLDDFLKSVSETLSDEAKMTVPQLIRHKGYPAEIHKVVTADGYVLEMHRIPRGRKQPRNRKGVVLLQHGLFCSSAAWIVTGPENALGYLLADEGYDVWMGNSRGNTYSRNNTHTTPDEGTFWNFSWHEMGVFDLPRMIDYILERTGSRRLFHVGHSQGTTAFYVMASEKPGYNRKIAVHFSLAPVAFMGHLFSPLLRLLSTPSESLAVVSNSVGMYEFLPNNAFLAKAADLFCTDSAPTQILCSNALFALCGYSPRQLNGTMLPVLVAHTPAGSALKQLTHYAQEIRDPENRFRAFDYGQGENLRRYGDEEPPEYHLDKVTAPVYLFYSGNDWMAAVEDVKKLYGKLRNAVVEMFLVEDEGFNHLDYIFGVEARDLVYHKVVELMGHY